MPGNPAIRGLTARSQEPQQHSGGHPRQLDVLYPGASGKTAADRTRKRTLTATVSTTVDASGGAGGLAARYDEHHWISLEARGTVVSARAQLAGLAQTWQATVPAGDVELRMEITPPPASFNFAAMGGDRIRLLAAGALVAELDGATGTGVAGAPSAFVAAGARAPGPAGATGRRRPAHPSPAGSSACTRPKERSASPASGTGAARPYGPDSLRRRILRRVPAPPRPGGRLRADGEGRLLGDPGRRVGLVDLGTGGRTV